MFRWMQTNQATPFTFSKEGHTIIFEMLFTLGGAAGLSHAVLLCCDAHSEGILSYYTFPTAATGSGEPPEHQQHDKDKASVMKELGLSEGDVILDGSSHIQAVVVLLAWLRSLRDHARWASIYCSRDSRSHFYTLEHA